MSKIKHMIVSLIFVRCIEIMSSFEAPVEYTENKTEVNNANAHGNVVDKTAVPEAIKAQAIRVPGKLDLNKVVAVHTAQNAGNSYKPKMTAPIQEYDQKLLANPSYANVAALAPEVLATYAVGYTEGMRRDHTPQQVVDFKYGTNWVDSDKSARSNLYNGLQFLNNVFVDPQFKNASPNTNQFMSDPVNNYVAALRKEWPHVSDTILATYVTIYLNDPVNYKYVQKPGTGPFGIIPGGNDVTQPIKITPTDLVDQTKNMRLPVESSGDVENINLTNSQKMYLTMNAIEDINKTYPEYHLTSDGVQLMEPGTPAAQSGASVKNDGIVFNAVSDINSSPSIASSSNTEIDLNNLGKDNVAGNIQQNPLPSRGLQRAGTIQIFTVKAESLPVVTDTTTPGVAKLIETANKAFATSTSWFSRPVRLSETQSLQRQEQFTENVKNIYGYDTASLDTATATSQELAFVKLSRDMQDMQLEKQDSILTTVEASIVPKIQMVLDEMSKEIAQKEIERLLINTDLTIAQLSQQIQEYKADNNTNLNRYKKSSATDKYKYKNDIIIAQQYDQIFTEASKLLDVMNEKLRSNISIDQARKQLQQAKNVPNGDFDTIIVLQKIVNELTNRSENKVNINKMAQSIWTKSTTALQAVQNNNVISEVKPITDSVVLFLKDLKNTLSKIETSEIDNREKYDEVLTDVDIFTAQYNKATKSVDINQRIRATDDLIESLRAAKNKNPEFLDLTLYLEVIENKLKPRLELIANCTNDLSKTKEDLAANLNKIKELKGKLNSSNIKQQIVELNKLINGSTMVLSKDFVSVDDLKILYDQLELELQEKQNQANPWYKNWDTWRKGYGQVSEGNIIPGTGKILYAGSLGIADATTQSLLDHTTSALDTMGLGQAWKDLDKSIEGKALKGLLVGLIFTAAATMIKNILQNNNLTDEQKRQAQSDIFSAVVGDVATNLIAYQTGASADTVANGSLEDIMLNGAINNATKKLTGSTGSTTPQTVSTKNIDNFKNQFQMQYGIDPTQRFIPTNYNIASNYNVPLIGDTTASSSTMNPSINQNLTTPANTVPSYNFAATNASNGSVSNPLQSKPAVPYSPYTSSPYVTAAG